MSNLGQQESLSSFFEVELQTKNYSLPALRSNAIAIPQICSAK